MKVTRELTERQDADEALRERGELFRLWVERVKDYAILMLDSDGHVVSWNEGAERIKGYRAEEILGQNMSRFYTREDVERGHPAHLLKMAEAEGRVEEEGWRVRKDGSRFWADVIITALRDDQGRLRGFGKVTRDLTERKQTEEALRASEEQFRAVSETANDAIVSADTAGNITYFNKAAERIFVYSANDVLGKPLTLLMPERFKDAHTKGLARFLATGETRVIGRTVELAGKRKNGMEFPLEISLANWKTEKGSFFTAIIRDTTERKRVEEETLRLNKQLEVANKELEAFSYSVSHDLRAPLRGIDGFSLALLEDYADKLDTKAQSYLQRVRAAAERMAQLIDDLLQLSRVARSDLSRKTVDLSAMAWAIAAELQRSRPERQVEFVIAEGLVASGDERLLWLALENLLRNSWKFTSKRSRATVEFGVLEKNGQTTYFVRDDGAGFDMAYADKLFGVFQRLHASDEFPGTGVGLATVQRLVHRHGGSIWAEGKVDQGATFYFTLSRNWQDKEDSHGPENYSAGGR